MASNSSILKTLIYSDIFDFPLTREEIWKFLIGKKIDKKTFEKDLEATPLGCNRKFYFLSGRKDLVAERNKKKEIGQKKIKIAKKIIKKLSLVPTVLFIGISGGLALENAKADDDIDLFVITSKNSLWITRLLLVILLILMGKYRGRGNPPAGGESNKICLNMLINEQSLMFEKDRQNLYTAHEIVQLRPMFSRDNVYNKFLFANKWVEKFMPNAIDRIKNHESRIMGRRKPLFVIHNSLFIFEKLAKVLQLLYMRKHITKETVSDRMLAFHPYEYKNYVLKEYNKRLKKYEI